MESDHPVRPNADPAQSGPGPDTHVTNAEVPISARGPAAAKLEIPLFKPTDNGATEAMGDVEPHVSTVLGPLPSGVSLAHTRDLNDTVHRILVIGLVISTVSLLIGVILDLVMGQSLSTVALMPREALAAVLDLQPSGFLALGLLVLLITPVVRVIGSIVVFVWEHDWRYALVTGFVLVIMTMSIIVGQG